MTSVAALAPALAVAARTNVCGPTACRGEAVSQELELAAVLEQMGGASRRTVCCPPLASNVAGVGETLVSDRSQLTAAGPFCTTVRIAVPTVTNPTRGPAPFARALSDTDPLPLPLNPLVRVMNEEMLAARHEADDGAVTATVSVENADPTKSVPGATETVDERPGLFWRTTTNSLPARSTAARNEFPVYADALRRTVPVPRPEKPSVTVVQPLPPDSTTVCQPHPFGSETVKEVAEKAEPMVMNEILRGWSHAWAALGKGATKGRTSRRLSSRYRCRLGIVSLRAQVAGVRETMPSQEHYSWALKRSATDDAALAPGPRSIPRNESFLARASAAQSR